MKRFLLGVAVATVLGSIAVTPASGASFNDSSPCPAQGPLLVCPTGLVGTPYSLQLLGIGGCDLYRWEIVNSALPAGLSLSSSGLVSGTPTAAGRAQFWVIIHDLLPSEGGHDWCAFDNQSEREYVIEIGPRVIVTTEAAGPGTVGQPYNLPLQAQMMYGPSQLTPPSSPLKWTIVEGSLPPGLALGENDGVISGTPTTAGAFLATFRAGLADGRADTKALQIIVRDPLVIAPVRLPPRGSEVGVPFEATLTATGGDGTFTWALASGALPTGIVMNPDGTLVGTPETAGRFPITFSVTDGEARTATVNLTLVIAAKLGVKTLRLREARIGRLYRAKLATLGGVAPTRWKLLRGTLPRGVRLDKKLGLLQGTPRTAGTYRLRLEVVDALGVKSQATLTLVVKPSAKKKKAKPTT